MIISSAVRNVPSSPFVDVANKFREFVRMQYARENFETVDDPRPRAGKVSTTVDNMDASIARGGKGIESWKFFQ